MTNDWVYDLETFPNVFTIALEHAESGVKVAWEISPWRNDSHQIVSFVDYLAATGARMIGFNNLGFDYPILHLLCRMGTADAETLYNKAQAIIASQDTEKFTHIVYPSDRIVPQIDLYKIHHFDNKARSTSLKLLEVNMRMDNVQDLPFKVGSVLTYDEAQALKAYNAHDVHATKLFYDKSLDMIRFREELSQKHGRDFMNHNDTKVGKDYFIMQLENAGVECYTFGPEGRTPKQTPRPTIALRDAILPWISFQQPEFNRVLTWLKEQVITETKGVFKDLTATVNGFTFVFGLGGIHGAVEREKVVSDDEWVIESWDVTSYYPNLAIKNRFYPQHLGEKFCDIYADLFEQRKKYPKKSSESATLKLALNGTYGDSNNKFSVFYDPLFTMKITLNGQLLLCMLAEKLMEVPTLRIIMINTDGLEYRVNRVFDNHAREVCAWWEQMTKLTLENVQYIRMWIRDVNNYVAESASGIKRKGAFEYDLEWHQNNSALVVPKVAEQVLLHGADAATLIATWSNPLDFLLRTKVPRSSILMTHNDDGETEHQRISRYYIAKGGPSLIKIMPPLKGKTGLRYFDQHVGYGVQMCNDLSEMATGLPVDHDYYINEVNKLIKGLT